MTANPRSASTVHQAFALLADFPTPFLCLLSPDDQDLIEDILPPWRVIIEWMYAHGELKDCSLRLFRDVLPLQEAILRRQDMPLDLREDIQRTLSRACRSTDLPRRQIIDRWNAHVVPICLIPRMAELGDIEQAEASSNSRCSRARALSIGPYQAATTETTSWF
jgi:hypothetical protein